MKHLQETATSPVAYDTAVRITMTWSVSGRVARPHVCRVGWLFFSYKPTATTAELLKCQSAGETERDDFVEPLCINCLFNLNMHLSKWSFARDTRNLAASDSTIR